MDPWGPEWDVDICVFFFSAVPRIFLLPHTEANRGAVDRRVSQQATVAQSTVYLGGSFS